ncbi:MAG: hypothetical protein Q4B26_08825 [Eubacteriales bacterium]|nr:hypothetical protein [Eubacteriales bacterium]
MWLIKLPVKIIAIPLVIVVTMIQWFGVFLIGCSAFILNSLAAICLLLAILGYLMQINTGAESIRMIIVGFVVFMVPIVGEWIIEKVMNINLGLRSFIWS